MDRTWFACGICLLLSVSSAARAADEDETQKYLGLNEFRHVVPNLSTLKCGSEAWEKGNYFVNEGRNSRRLFTPNQDTLTIKLKGAYFDFAPEASKFRPWVNKEEVQVGIFADISSKGGSLAAPGSGGIPGRLVFFSDNYLLRQRRIADINTNMYGPVMYTGGGLAIKLTMLEFDQSKDDRLADTLMKSVAELGAKASGGVPAYLEGPLTALFQSALSAAKSRDDMFGQLTFVLDDRNGIDNEPTSPLRTGDIVLVRKANRTNPIDWDNLCYDPSTAEVFERESVRGKPSDRKPPRLNYVAISLLKNAGADAGRIQDALTYERIVAELQQRKPDAGLISSVAEVVTALKERATSRELSRQIDTVGRTDGSVTELERFDASSLLAPVLYSSLLAFDGFDAAKISKLDDCKYLVEERVKNETLSRLFVRLRNANEKYTRDSIEVLIKPAPKDCIEANKALSKVQQQLLKPT